MYRSWFTPLARVAAPIALATMAACGSDSSTGTTGGLTASQKTALQNLLSNTTVQNALAGGKSEGAFVGIGLAESGGLGLNSIGTINFGSGASPSRLVPTGKLALSPNATVVTGPSGTFQAFGAQLVLHYVTGPGDTTHAVWTGFIAVDNLSTPTVLVTAGVVDYANTAPTSIQSTSFGSTDSGTRFATASYVKINGETYDSFYATTGNIAVTSASFSESTACPAAQVTGALKACSYASGTIGGSFNFTGTEIVNHVPTSNTVTIPAMTFNVPAAQTAVTIDVTPPQ